MNIGQIIAKYWIEWVCGLITTGIGFGIGFFVRYKKKSFANALKECQMEVKADITTSMTNQIEEVRKESNEADELINKKIDVLTKTEDNITQGLLSMQGKQFREFCICLLEPGHSITMDEYEQFEEDYAAYKGLGGNHKGDALHDRVVEKFSHQMKQ